MTTDSAWIYNYDYENRLTQAANSSLTDNYTYDAFGRRTQKRNNAITNYIYDGDQLIAEYDSSGNLLKKHIYGPGIDELLTTSDLQLTTNYYYHFDGLGSITELTDSTGAVIEKYSYDAWGKTAIRNTNNEPLTTSAVGNPYGFTGRELDSETGLYYYRARYYSPELGRFLQRDPIGYWAGPNLYTYCSNNPVNWVDPWGWEKQGNKGNFPRGVMIPPTTTPESPKPQDKPKPPPRDPRPKDPTPSEPTKEIPVPDEFTRKTKWWEWVIWWIEFGIYEYFVPPGTPGVEPPVPPIHKDWPGFRKPRLEDYRI